MVCETLSLLPTACLQRAESLRVLVSFMPISSGKWHWYRPSDLQPFADNTGVSTLPLSPGSPSL